MKNTPITLEYLRTLRPGTRRHRKAVDKLYEQTGSFILLAQLAWDSVEWSNARALDRQSLALTRKANALPVA